MEISGPEKILEGKISEFHQVQLGPDIYLFSTYHNPRREAMIYELYKDLGGQAQDLRLMQENDYIIIRRKSAGKDEFLSYLELYPKGPDEIGYLFTKEGEQKKGFATKFIYYGLKFLRLLADNGLCNEQINVSQFSGTLNVPLGKVPESGTAHRLFWELSKREFAKCAVKFDYVHQEFSDSTYIYCLINLSKIDFNAYEAFIREADKKYNTNKSGSKSLQVSPLQHNGLSRNTSKNDRDYGNPVSGVIKTGKASSRRVTGISTIPENKKREDNFWFMLSNIINFRWFVEKKADKKTAANPAVYVSINDHGDKLRRDVKGIKILELDDGKMPESVQLKNTGYKVNIEAGEMPVFASKEKGKAVFYIDMKNISAQKKAGSFDYAVIDLLNQLGGAYGLKGNKEILDIVRRLGISNFSEFDFASPVIITSDKELDNWKNNRLFGSIYQRSSVFSLDEANAEDFSLKMRNTIRNKEAELKARIGQTSIESDSYNFEAAIQDIKNLDATNIGWIFHKEIFKEASREKIAELKNIAREKNQKIIPGFYFMNLSVFTKNTKAEIENLINVCGLDGLYLDLSPYNSDADVNEFLKWISENLRSDITVSIASHEININPSLVKANMKLVKDIKSGSIIESELTSENAYKLAIPPYSDAESLLKIIHLPSSIDLILNRNELRLASEKIRGLLDAASFRNNLFTRVLGLNKAYSAQTETGWVNNLLQEDVLACDLRDNAVLLSDVYNGSPDLAERFIDAAGRSSVAGIHMAELKADNVDLKIINGSIKVFVERQLAEQELRGSKGEDFEFEDPEVRQSLGALRLGQIVYGKKASEQEIEVAKRSLEKSIEDYKAENPVREEFLENYPEGNYPSVCAFALKEIDKIGIDAQGGSKKEKAVARDIMIELLKLWSEPKLKTTIQKHQEFFNIQSTKAALQAA